MAKAINHDDQLPLRQGWRAHMTGSETKPTIARSYDAQAAGYDRRWASYTARSTELTLDALPGLAPGARVLDVGCGTGPLLGALRDRDAELALTGVDVSEAMLAQASARLGAQAALCRAPAERLPFDDASFDAVVTASALHHWPEPERGLAEIARVLTAGGGLVVTDWCRESWPMRLMDRYLRLRDAAHHRALTRRELAGLVAGAGFDIDNQTRHRIDRLWQLQVLTAHRGGASAAPPPSGAGPP